MKHLRINNRQGEFLRGNEWVVITEIIADDILNLARAAVTEEDFETDSFDDSALLNPAQKIIYQKISEQLMSLHARKQEFIDETRNVFQDAYDKYCKE
jgi:hypothetical protein